MAANIVSWLRQRYLVTQLALVLWTDVLLALMLSVKSGTILSVSSVFNI